MPNHSPRSDHELVADVLGNGAGDELVGAAVALSSIPFASRRLLSAEEVTRRFSIGGSMARRLVALWELAERWYPDARPLVGSVRDATLLLEHLRSAPREQVDVICLDARHRAIAVETVSVGTVNASRLHARDVFGPAIRHSAVAVIVGHNHPSGDASPSHSDHVVTASLSAASDLLGIPLLDHIILTAHGQYSFRESEWNQAWNAAA